MTGYNLAIEVTGGEKLLNRAGFHFIQPSFIWLYDHFQLNIRGNRAQCYMTQNYNSFIIFEVSSRLLTDEIITWETKSKGQNIHLH